MLVLIICLYSVHMSCGAYFYDYVNFTLQSQPHELVYAKPSGFPYWPAKVMEVKPEGCDVRFFGPGHHRYNISDPTTLMPVAQTVHSHTLAILVAVFQVNSASDYRVNPIPNLSPLTR